MEKNIAKERNTSNMYYYSHQTSWQQRKKIQGAKQLR
jgi:hypothetical protein